MEDDRRFSYFFLGLGLGVAVGLLFAPKSGEETRRVLRSKAEGGRDYVLRRTKEVREGALGLVERGKDVVNRQKDQIASAFEAGKQAYRESVGKPETPAEATESGS